MYEHRIRQTKKSIKVNIYVAKKEPICFKCKNCDKEFPQMKELKVHILLKHTDMKKKIKHFETKHINSYVIKCC